MHFPRFVCKKPKETNMHRADALRPAAKRSVSLLPTHSKHVADNVCFSMIEEYLRLGKKPNAYVKNLCVECLRAKRHISIRDAKSLIRQRIAQVRSAPKADNTYCPPPCALPPLIFNRPPSPPPPFTIGFVPPPPCVPPRPPLVMLGGSSSSSALLAFIKEQQLQQPQQPPPQQPHPQQPHPRQQKEPPMQHEPQPRPALHQELKPSPRDKDALMARLRELQNQKKVEPLPQPELIQVFREPEPAERQQQSQQPQPVPPPPPPPMNHPSETSPEFKNPLKVCAPPSHVQTWTHLFYKDLPYLSPGEGGPTISNRPYWNTTPTSPA